MLVNLNDVLYDARAKKYAVGLFNATDSDMLQATVEAAEEMSSPIIIGTAEVLLPYGDLNLIAPGLINRAKNSTVPVVVHFDHGLTFNRCMEALNYGFSSVMFDGSEHPYEENIYQTREIVKIAHSMGASVEGEIGHVGSAEGSAEGSGDGDKSQYTTVEEAVAYVKETGVDALAISIGTAHGAYKSAPKLDIQRLKEIREAVGVPLVLHGGSGLSDQDFRNCIANGISKVNIFTDICIAGTECMKRFINTDMHYVEFRNRKVEAMKHEVKKKLTLFGSSNRYYNIKSDIVLKAHTVSING